MISKRLLIDTIEVISNEDDGNGGNDVSITIENVRFSREINLGSSAMGDMVSGARRIFVDEKYSTHYEFKLNDRIKYQGDEYTIIKIVDARNESLQHKELYVK
jgi:hypothetical protein